MGRGSGFGVPLAVQVARTLAGEIRSGAFAVGVMLPSEAELAQRFGVSRPSVREALSALQFAGFVGSRRGFGSVVLAAQPAWAATAGARAATSWGEVADLLEARLVLEPAVTALSAADPDLEKLDVANDMVRGMRVAVSGPRLSDDTDHRVHAALAGVCCNTVLAGLVHDLLKRASGPTWAAGQAAAWTDGHVVQGWCDDHAAVIAAIAAGDPQSAAAASRRHLLSAARNVLTVDDLPPVGA